MTTWRRCRQGGTDQTRPVLLVTREAVREVRALVAVAPITTTVRGLRSKVPVGVRNALDDESAVNLDLVTTIPRYQLLRPLGALLRDQEKDLT